MNVLIVGNGFDIAHKLPTKYRVNIFQKNDSFAEKIKTHYFTVMRLLYALK